MRSESPPGPGGLACLTLLATAVLGGCAAGVRLHDEPKAQLTATAKADYARADVVGIVEAERRNLEQLLIEELKVVRESNRLELDFALLSLADDASPMGNTYREEAMGRLRRLGFARGAEVAHLRQWLIGGEHVAVFSREVEERRGRLGQVLGQDPPGCQEAMEMDALPIPDGRNALQARLARAAFPGYQAACRKVREAQRISQPPGGAIAGAMEEWTSARDDLEARAAESARQRQDVARARATYREARDEVEAAERRGEEVAAEIRAGAEKAKKGLELATKALGAVGATQMNVEHIVVLLTATAGGEVDPNDDEVRRAAEALRALPPLAGDMAALIAESRAPSVNNLLLEMQHQVLALENAQRRATLARERVDILGTKVDAYRMEARHWLEFTDAVCSYAMLEGGQPFPGAGCDGFTVSVDGASCAIDGGASVSGCALGEPWSDALRATRAGAAKRELYKALSGYLRALAGPSRQSEETFHLIDVRHRETLLAKETAIKQWNNLVQVPIDQLDAYYQAGIRASEIADVLVKAIGLTAIAIGVSQ